jgi:hypothetical protein
MSGSAPPADTVTGRAAAAAAAALAAQAFGEDFGCDAAWDIAPSPAGPQLAVRLLVTLRSPLLGAPPLWTATAFPGVPSGEQAAEAACQAAARLRAAARQLLTPQNGSPP